MREAIRILAREPAMTAIDAFFRVLQRTFRVKRSSPTPADLATLKQRISDVEAKLGRTVPPKTCPACGANEAHLSHLFGPFESGEATEVWACLSCGHHHWTTRK